jgi:phosphatidylglycerol:prolipoprotein diacylglycerol transferase
MRAKPNRPLSDMIDELFHIGSFAISPFGVLLVCAFLASYLQLRWGMKHLGIGDEEDASAVVFAAGVGGIVGAKVYYALLKADWRSLYDRAGLVWYGGFILGAIAVIWTLRRRRLPAWPMVDIATLALALGYGIGRIGCFLVGDDYGRPTTLPWAVAFPKGLPPTTAGDLRWYFQVDLPASIQDSTLLKVHPTQVYETLAALAIWLVGLRVFKRQASPGATAAVVLSLLAVERFLVEFLRIKDDRFLGPLTLAQAISLLVLVLMALATCRRRSAA